MNGRLDSIQAAVLLAKLPLLEEELAARARDRRAGTPSGAAPASCRRRPAAPGADSAWGIYTDPAAGRAPRATRVQAAMQAAGVPSAIYYPKPLHHQPAYAAAPCRRARRRRRRRCR